GVPGVLEFAAFHPAAVKLPPTASNPVLLPFVLDDQLRAAEKQILAARKKGDAAALKAAELRPAMIRAVFAAEKSTNDKSLAKAAAVAEAAYKLAQAEADLAQVSADTKAKDADKKIAAA